MGWQGLDTSVSIYRKDNTTDYVKDNLPEDDKIYIFRGKEDIVRKKQNKQKDSFIDLPVEIATKMKQNIDEYDKDDHVRFFL